MSGRATLRVFIAIDVRIKRGIRPVNATCIETPITPRRSIMIEIEFLLGLILVGLFFIDHRLNKLVKLLTGILAELRKEPRINTDFHG